MWGITLGRADLVMDLRPEPSGEIHLMPYLMQRLVTIAKAAKVAPVGAWWRAPARGLLATPEETYQAALRGRAIGTKGSMCLDTSQVEALNRGFTPSEAELDDAQRLIQAHDAAANGGRAATRLGDRIVDLAAARQARRLLDYASACAVRDRAKAEAAQRAT
jgi:citrate lyase subunit beta/citryl-CoA lyase